MSDYFGNAMFQHELIELHVENYRSCPLREKGDSRFVKIKSTSHKVIQFSSDIID